MKATSSAARRPLILLVTFCIVISSSPSSPSSSASAFVNNPFAATSSSSRFRSSAIRRDRHPTRVAIVDDMNMSANGSLQQHPSRHPHCDLPGDPSLILTTNVDLGDDKVAIMKELSSLVAKVTGKPESYVGECAVCITDKASMLFGGSDAPLALGCLYSLGGIDRVNNGKVQAGVTDVFEKRGLGIAQDRMYINFFDMPRECVGWNRATFAG